MIKSMPFRIVAILSSCTLLIQASCNKNGSSPSGSGATVYVAGFLGTPGLTTTGTLWRNGVAVNVPGSSGIASMCLSDTDVYLLSGNTYWKNGVSQTIPNAVFTKSIRVSGTDVYVAGSTIPASNSGVGSTAAALYFKNGTQVNLTQSLNNVVAAFTNGIAVSGPDVYVAGYLYLYNNDTLDAAYWKNGVLNFLPNGYMAKAIAVSGSDVYVAGTPIHGTDVYWKNGVMQGLGNNAIANCIVVSGSDVYVGGTTYGANRAVYWKNGVEVDLPNGYTVNDMAIVGSDVYAAGNANGGYAVYWKNGVIDTLGIGGASAIVVRQ